MLRWQQRKFSEALPALRDPTFCLVARCLDHASRSGMGPVFVPLRSWTRTVPPTKGTLNLADCVLVRALESSKRTSLSQSHALSAKNVPTLLLALERKTFLQVQAKLHKGKKPGNSGGDNPFGRGPSFASGSSGVGSPVPSDQQPVNEYQNLVNSVLFSWAVGDLRAYYFKLSAMGGAVATLLGWPVMAWNLNPEDEVLKCSVGALCGGLLAVTLAALRMYLGWAYVGNRLFSATVEYEETGWYDGQIWVKPPEVLARDRLLGSYKVKPALNRVKLTLVGLAASLVTCTLFLVSLEDITHGRGQEAFQNMEDEAYYVNKPLGGPYNEASARMFEPEAFGNESKLDGLPDYCY